MPDIHRGYGLPIPSPGLPLYHCFPGVYALIVEYMFFWKRKTNTVLLYIYFCGNSGKVVRRTSESLENRAFFPSESPYHSENRVVNSSKLEADPAPAGANIFACTVDILSTQKM